MEVASIFAVALFVRRIDLDDLYLPGAVAPRRAAAEPAWVVLGDAAGDDWHRVARKLNCHRSVLAGWRRSDNVAAQASAQPAPLGQSTGGADVHCGVTYPPSARELLRRRRG